LENSIDLVVEDAYNAEKLYSNYPTRQGKISGLKILADQHKEAITAIKEALAQPEQEPVAWWNDTGTHIDLNVSGRGTPLYTTPPQRTWVGLTDMEVQNIVYCRSPNIANLRKAEQLLKDKNT
jgi:hypothetical protein